MFGGVYFNQYVSDFDEHSWITFYRRRHIGPKNRLAECIRPMINRMLMHSTNDSSNAFGQCVAKRHIGRNCIILSEMFVDGTLTESRVALFIESSSFIM